MKKNKKLPLATKISLCASFLALFLAVIQAITANSNHLQHAIWLFGGVLFFAGIGISFAVYSIWSKRHNRKDE